MKIRWTNLKYYHIVGHYDIGKTYNKNHEIVLSKLQTHYHFNIQEGQYTRGKWLSTAPNTTRTINYKVWNSTVEYTSRKIKHNIRESEGNMVNPCGGGDTQGGVHLQKQTGENIKESIPYDHFSRDG